MEDLLQAFITFLTDLFAALNEFLGGKLAFGDILGGITDIMGETTTAPAVTE